MEDPQEVFMVDEQIVNWVKENLSKGYTVEQVKAIMLQRYSSEEVTDGILLALQPEAQAKSKPGVSKKMIWSMVISLGIAILLLFFLLSSPAPKGTMENLAPPANISQGSSALNESHAPILKNQTPLNISSPRTNETKINSSG